MAKGKSEKDKRKIEERSHVRCSAFAKLMQESRKVGVEANINNQSKIVFLSHKCLS